MPKVLIVEDDDAMAVALRDGFQYEGYEVALARDGAAGLKEATDTQPDLMILDVMLPKMSGLDILKEIRARGSGLPVIMLTARGQEIDKVLGLKLGADDYIAKPFGFLELMARVEAVLRRAAGHAAGPATMNYQFGAIACDFRKGEIRRKGRRLDLSAREIRLLHYFVENRGKVVPRDELLDAVWDYDSAPITRTVDMHIAKLRKKIEDVPSEPRWLVTIHGTGYKFTG